MIDLHFHCLPGIDDGPESWDAALELCRAAIAEGTTRIVATPHVLREPWLNERTAEREALRAELVRRLEGSLEVLPGCEYWFTLDALELLDAGEAGPLVGLNGGRYLLVEFPPGWVPAEADAAFHEMALRGVTPVVAHPERNLALAAAPARLARLREVGAVAQVTAGSLLGEFGRTARAAAWHMLEEGLADVVASDAHGARKRLPRLAAAREAVRRELGAAAELGLFVTNPEAMLRSEALPWRMPA